MPDYVRPRNMGEPGTAERERWVAGCSLHDLEATAALADEQLTPELVRSVLRDGAEALRRMLVLTQGGRA